MEKNSEKKKEERTFKRQFYKLENRVQFILNSKNLLCKKQ